MCQQDRRVEGRLRRRRRYTSQRGIGSAGEGGIRTCWDLTLTLGIPFLRLGATPFIVRSIPFPSHALTEANECPEEEYTAPHPFQMALNWRQEMAANAQLIKARIAGREGLCRARVTQITASAGETPRRKRIASAGRLTASAGDRRGPDRSDLWKWCP
jgi:hypothetical protein